MWRKIRITILLFILLTVAQEAWNHDGAPHWKRTLYVNLYPINADGSLASTLMIANLKNEQFNEIKSYMEEQSAHYKLSIEMPFEFHLENEVKIRPPKQLDNNLLFNILWSLQFRFWSYVNTPKSDVKPDIKLYLLYFDPKTNPLLRHSTALSKGRLGLVNLFANRIYLKQNNVIIAHELLHTVNATDKYNLSNTLPYFPIGFAEPEKIPLYPQEYAELMAGRIPISESSAEIPLGLENTLIGELTAKEIGWTK